MAVAWEPEDDTLALAEVMKAGDTLWIRCVAEARKLIGAGLSSRDFGEESMAHVLELARRIYDAAPMSEESQQASSPAETPAADAVEKVIAERLVEQAKAIADFIENLGWPPTTPVVGLGSLVRERFLLTKDS